MVLYQQVSVLVLVVTTTAVELQLHLVLHIIMARAVQPVIQEDVRLQVVRVDI